MKLPDLRMDVLLISVPFHITFSIVFTKADKLSSSKVAPTAAAYMDKLKETWDELPPYFISSSETKRGRDEILDYIENINKTLKQ